MYPGLSTNPRSEIQSRISEPFTEEPSATKKHPSPPICNKGGIKKTLVFKQKKRKKTKLFFKYLFLKCLLSLTVGRKLHNPRLFSHAASGKIPRNSERPKTANRNVRAEIYLSLIHI